MLAGLAVSNIAWPQADFACGIALARNLGLRGIEIAPYNVFASWDVADRDVRALHAQIGNAGLVCPALQEILFNVPNVALFESGRSREALPAHLAKVARMAGLLGAAACVLGAPRQRDPGALPLEAAWDIAVAFLQRIGPVFADHGTTLAFEANARAYACRFVTTTREAVDLVRQVDTPGIALQIDTGTIFLEREDPSVLEIAAPLASHAHVSEPGLQPLGSSGIDHRGVGEALKASGYAGFLSIEMRATEDWQDALPTAVALLERDYS